MPKGIPSKRYTPEFKKIVIETMLAEKLSYRETASRSDVSCDTGIARLSRLLQQPPHKGKLKGLPSAIHRQQALSPA